MPKQPNITAAEAIMQSILEHTPPVLRDMMTKKLSETIEKSKPSAAKPENSKPVSSAKE